MPKTPYFTRELFQFLFELKFNNERAWFNANKPRYEEHLKKPFLRFIEALAPRLSKVNPAYVADPRSFFRIYRDTRFAKDKTPYKTHVAAQFRHEAAIASPKGVAAHLPGFYLHLEPGESFGGGGIWMPEPEPLKAIRLRIAKKDPAWMKLKAKRTFLWDEDKMKRPPKGFRADDPMIEDLKLRHYITGTDFTDKQVLSSDFLDRYVESVRKTDPLVRFLCVSMGMKA